MVVNTLVNLGLQEVISHRQTTPERDRRLAPGTLPMMYLTCALLTPSRQTGWSAPAACSTACWKPWSEIRSIRTRMALFEAGPIFMASEAGERPDELQRLAIVLIGPRSLPGWQKVDTGMMDFYDLKGVVSGLLQELHIDVRFEPGEHPTFHPGKTARMLADEHQLGIIGELHPLVHERYDFPPNPVLAAEFNPTF
jgi:phenylalanyl-tRNA synthetase beta chain